MRHANLVYYSGRIEEEAVHEDNPGFEIINAENSKKVIRGGYFELIVYIHSQKRVYGNYSFIVNLVNLDNSVRIRTGQYAIKELRDWPKDTVVKIGPIKVLTPSEVPLGTSIVEIRMLRNSDLHINASYAKSAIEVISYNQN